MQVISLSPLRLNPPLAASYRRFQAEVCRKERRRRWRAKPTSPSARCLALDDGLAPRSGGGSLSDEREGTCGALRFPFANARPLLRYHPVSALPPHRKQFDDMRAALYYLLMLLLGFACYKFGQNLLRKPRWNENGERTEGLVGPVGLLVITGIACYPCLRFCARWFGVRCHASARLAGIRSTPWRQTLAITGPTCLPSLGCCLA
jgi:hypothetical protein